MTLHELNQLRRLKREIRLQNKRLSELERKMSYSDPDEIKQLKERIYEQISLLNKRCLEEQERIEQYIYSIDDSLIRQIVVLRFVEGFKWEHVAARVGGNNTEDSVKKIVFRYIERKNKND